MHEKNQVLIKKIIYNRQEKSYSIIYYGWKPNIFILQYDNNKRNQKIQILLSSLENKDNLNIDAYPKR